MRRFHLQFFNGVKINCSDQVNIRVLDCTHALNFGDLGLSLVGRPCIRQPFFTGEHAVKNIEAIAIKPIAITILIARSAGEYLVIFGLYELD